VISVVMPAHNEQAYLGPAVERVVTALRARPGSFEVIVCENGSTDETDQVAKALGHAHPEVRVVTLAEADYGCALKSGFLAATGDLVVNFDVDFVDLGFLDAAVALAGGGAHADVVVGSKRGPGADDQRRAGRKVVTAVFSLVLRAGFGLRVSDTHGLKLLRRAALTPLVAACRFGRDIFDTELVLRAERAGLIVKEIPVIVADQRPPRTPITQRIPRSLAGLARLRVALWQEEFRHRKSRQPSAGHDSATA
jgi:glycosyltransferase involved in cell wall biosynthesis